MYWCLSIIEQSGRFKEISLVLTEVRTPDPPTYSMYGLEYAAEYLACIIFSPLYSVSSVRMTILQHQENKAIYLS
jgi:hypothetical protein